MPRRKGDKGRENLYISQDQAQALTGISKVALRYHARKGHIRYRRIPNGRRGPSPYQYHIDDLQLHAYPKIPDIARAVGRHPNELMYLIRHWSMPGLCRIGRRYRVHPDAVPDWLAWLRDGRPVRPPFIPKNHNGKSGS